MNDDARRQNSRRIRRYEGWGLFLAGLFYVALRALWVGHLLTWDEAATLCSVRSFAAQGSDYYAGWFWRRPPFYNLLLVALRPLSPGLHIRAQLLSLVIACCVAIVIWVINKGVYGRGVAWWSLFFLAVMPGAVFYDTWIKQDLPAALFGLLAIWFFVKGRPLYSGLCLGAGFLSKELAIFYAGVLFVLWWENRQNKTWRDLAAVYIVAGIMAGWWYLLFSNSVKAVWRFLTDPSNEETRTWFRPWYYFLEKLSVDLEGWGILLAVFGCVALWMRRGPNPLRGEPAKVGITCAATSWPLALLVPAYALITFMRAKTPWFTISLFPAWATLQGIGCNALLQHVREGGQGRWRRLGSGALAVAVILGTTYLRWGRDYEAELRAREWGLWRGSYTSRATAQKLNELVKDNERLLITPMFYWNIPKKIPCVVFVYYLKPGIPVVVRDYSITADEFVKVVRDFKLHWAMVSPEPGEGEKVLIRPLITTYGLQPLWNLGACIFRTDSLWREQPGPSGEDRGQEHPSL